MKFMGIWNTICHRIIPLAYADQKELHSYQCEEEIWIFQNCYLHIFKIDKLKFARTIYCKDDIYTKFYHLFLEFYQA